MSAFVKVTLLLSSLLLHTSLAATQQPNYPHDWLDAGRLLSPYIWPHRQPFIELVQLLLAQDAKSTKPQLSLQCTGSLSSFASALQEQREDAMLLFDSFAKVSPGLLTDRLQDFGHYSQCHKSSFQGEASVYLLLAVHWPLPLNISSHFTFAFNESAFEAATNRSYNSSWIAKFNRNVDSLSIYPQLLAICLPASCKDGDIDGLLLHLNSHISPLKLTLFSSESIARDPFEEYNGSLVQIVSRSLLVLLVTFSLVSTCLCHLQPMVFTRTFCNHFDAVQHTRRLFSFPPSHKQRSTEFISGYKGLYLITAISNHAYMPLTPAVGFHYVPIHTLEVFDPLWNTFQRGMATFNVNVSVSAMLNSISWIEQLEKTRGKTTFALFLLLRVLRTLPVTVVCLLLIYSLPVLPVPSGPLVTRAQKSILTNCINNGWKELLFVSNFQNIRNICYPVGWYLSADLQLYALSYIPLIALAVRPKLGYLLIACQVTLGVVSEAFIILSNDIHPALPMMNIPSVEKMFAVLAYTHSYTHNYLSCYAMGLFGGYLIAKSASINMSSTRMTQTVGVILISLVPSFFAISSYDGCHFKYERMYEVALASIFRTSQSLSFCLFSFLLSRFPSFIISKLLSNPMLILASRMSFSMFMIHPFIMALLFSSRLDTDYSRSYYTMLILFVFVLSFLIGYVIIVSVEYPFNSLLRSALKPIAKTNTDTQETRGKKQS